MASQHEKHSWLSPIVGACCKSKTSTQVPSTGLSQLRKEKFTSYPKTRNNSIVVGRISQFHAGAGIKQNRLSLPFPTATKTNVLGHHYFAPKHRETSQIKFKPALHSLSRGFGLSGGHPTFGDEPLTPICVRHSFSLMFSEPSHPYTTVEPGGLPGDLMVSPSKRHKVPFILYGITA
jgi:hypothetical protein